MSLLSYCRTWRLRPESSCLLCFLPNDGNATTACSFVSIVAGLNFGVSGYFHGAGKMRLALSRLLSSPAVSMPWVCSDVSDECEKVRYMDFTV